MATSAQSGWIVSGHDHATPERRPSPRFLFHIYDARHADRRRAATVEDRMLLSGGRRHGGEVARIGTLNKSGDDDATRRSQSSIGRDDERIACVERALHP